MAKVQLVAPDDADLVHLAQHLRAADLAEIRAVHGADADVLGILRASVAMSAEAHVAVTVYGEPVAVFGVAAAGAAACPWLLGTNALLQQGREIVTLSQQHVARWALQYRILFNYVDARNARSIAWLRHTGFTIGPAEPYGQGCELFHRFERCT